MTKLETLARSIQEKTHGRRLPGPKDGREERPWPSEMTIGFLAMARRSPAVIHRQQQMRMQSPR